MLILCPTGPTCALAANQSPVQWGIVWVLISCLTFQEGCLILRSVGIFFIWPDNLPCPPLTQFWTATCSTCTTGMRTKEYILLFPGLGIHYLKIWRSYKFKYKGRATWEGANVTFFLIKEQSVVNRLGAQIQWMSLFCRGWEKTLKQARGDAWF